MPRSIVYTPLPDVVSADANPKDHDIGLLRESMRRFAYTEPIIVDDRTGKLVSGHGRLESLLAEYDECHPPPEGIRVASDGTWMVPVVRGWSSKDDTEAHALLIAANRITEVGGWVEDKLAALVSGMLNLTGIGLTESDIDDLLAKLEEDAAPAPAAPPPPGLRNQQVRSMVLHYPLDDYWKVAEAATAARVVYGVESNAELFESMLRAWDAAHPAA